MVISAWFTRTRQVPAYELSILRRVDFEQNLNVRM